MVMEPKMAGAIMNADWVTDETAADPTPLPALPGFRIMVRPMRVQGKTKDMNYLTTVGRVLAVGDLAYADKEKFPNGPWAKVGDYVCYGKMNGNKIRYKGVNLILLYDDQVVMRIDDPADIDPMFNIAS
jgi:co-chaperonin GroES (HSP10)